MIKQLVAFLVFVFASAHPALGSDFVLSSEDIAEGKALSKAQVFNGFGCDGGNVSPQLSWENAPEGTKSFAVTAYDPDAPTGSGWWHWVAFNIPASVKELASNASQSMPSGTIQARSDFGSHQFGGACPPPGQVHRYIFTVYALNVERLDLDETASAALVGFMVKSNALSSDKVTAVYSR